MEKIPDNMPPETLTASPYAVMCFLQGQVIQVKESKVDSTKTVTLVTFCLFGIAFLRNPLTDTLRIGESVEYIRTAMTTWDFYIADTRDGSAAVIFTDPQTHTLQAVIY